MPVSPGCHRCSSRPTVGTLSLLKHNGWLYMQAFPHQVPVAMCMEEGKMHTLQGPLFYVPEDFQSHLG